MHTHATFALFRIQCSHGHTRTRPASTATPSRQHRTETSAVVASRPPFTCCRPCRHRAPLPLPHTPHHHRPSPQRHQPVTRTFPLSLRSPPSAARPLLWLLLLHSRLPLAPLLALPHCSLQPSRIKAPHAPHAPPAPTRAPVGRRPQPPPPAAARPLLPPPPYPRRVPWLLPL